MKQQNRVPVPAKVQHGAGNVKLLGPALQRVYEREILLPTEKLVLVAASTASSQRITAAPTHAPSQCLPRETCHALAGMSTPLPSTRNTLCPCTYGTYTHAHVHSTANTKWRIPDTPQHTTRGHVKKQQMHSQGTCEKQ